MTEAYLEDRGLYYRFNLIGPEKPTLYFVHGLVGSSSAWQAYDKLFEQQFNIVELDLRGHGKSKKWPNYEDYKIEALAEDIETIAIKLNLAKFFLVGHSFGAPIAVKYASNHKERICGLILLAPIFNTQKNAWYSLLFGPVETLSSIANSLPFEEAPGRQMDYSKYYTALFWDPWRIKDEIKNTTVRTFLFCLKNIYSFDAETLLSTIQKPILIVHGKKDTLVPFEKSLAAAEATKSIELVPLESANHLLILNAIPQVAEAIAAFVQRHDESFNVNVEPTKIAAT